MCSNTSQIFSLLLLLMHSLDYFEINATVIALQQLLYSYYISYILCSATAPFSEEKHDCSSHWFYVGEYGWSRRGTILNQRQEGKVW